MGAEEDERGGGRRKGFTLVIININIRAFLDTCILEINMMI
jgi:hypothetical protein